MNWVVLFLFHALVLALLCGCRIDAQTWTALSDGSGTNRFSARAGAISIADTNGYAYVVCTVAFDSFVRGVSYAH
jgi:hypothetical protein